MSEIFDRFAQVANQFPKKLAIVTLDQQVSYHALSQLVNQWYNILTEFSLTQQIRPRVALLSENSITITAVSLALAKLNGCCIPTNPQLTRQQLQHAWLTSDVNLVLFDHALEKKVTIDKHNTWQKIKLDHSNEPNTRKNTNLLVKQFNQKKLNEHISNWHTQQDFIITLSSGSTGSPKPICLSQQCKLLRAQQSWQLYQVTANDTVLSASPFFHSLGQRLTFVPLLCGATLVHLQPFTPQQWLALVEQHQVSFAISVASHLYALKNALLNNSQQLKSLRCIVTSSAPIDAHFKAQLFTKIGCEFHEMYGATEIATATNLTPNNAKQHHDSVGEPCPNVAMTIVDDKHDTVTINTVGEIAIKSPLAFSGYYQQATLTANAWHNNYFLTGDLGKIDEQGFLHYVARKKDVIISGGINIYPIDIEKVLMQHADVSEVAVIGVNDNFLGEVIIAVCVGTNNNKTMITLSQLALKHLAPFQRPLKYYFVDVLPTTASGKVSKLTLRERYNALDEDWSLPLRMMCYH